VALRRLAAPVCGQSVADREFDLASPDADVSVRSSSRWSSRIALRRRRSAVSSRASRVLRRTSARSHFADARTASRTHAWRTRLRWIEACRRSSNGESGGSSCSNMVGPPEAGALELLRDTAVDAATRRHGCLAATAVAGLQEGFGLAGISLEIFWRLPKKGLWMGESPPHSRRHPWEVPALALRDTPPALLRLKAGVGRDSLVRDEDGPRTAPARQDAGGARTSAPAPRLRPPPGS
jgi:hypothetical protein